MKQIDFLPERIRLSRRRRRALIRQCYLMALCLISLALLGYVRQGGINQAGAELSLLKERSDNLAVQIAMRGVLERQQAELLMKQRIDEHLGSRVSALDILGELEKVMSDTLTLTDMKMEAMDVRARIQRANSASQPLAVSAVPLEETVEITRRVRLVLTGLAPTDIDVADFIGQLASSPLFEDIEMGYSQAAEYDNRKVREFQVTCFVVR